MIAPTPWWWVRHAPVPGAESHIYGQMDLSCDTSDSTAFGDLAAILPDDAVWIVSPLCRTHETLKAIANAGRPIPTPSVEPDLTEQHFGRWQGLSWAQMQEDDPEAYDVFWRDPLRSAPPGGEAYVDQMRRTRTAISRLTEQYGGRNIVCVSHGGTIRAAVADALDLPPERAMAIVIDNLSVTKLTNVVDGLLRGHGGIWRVEAVNAPSRWIRRASPW